MIFGIGRVCHIAFWEPHFADEFAQRRRMEGTDAPARCQAPSADDRAERADQLQEPDDAGSGLRQHDRPGALPPGRPDHRRRRRRLRPRHAVARGQPLDDPPLRAGPLGPQLVHAHPARPAVLPPGPGRPAGAGDELNRAGRRDWARALSQLNFRVDRPELAAIVVDPHLPVDTALVLFTSDHQALVSQLHLAVVGRFQLCQNGFGGRSDVSVAVPKAPVSRACGLQTWAPRTRGC